MIENKYGTCENCSDRRKLVLQGEVWVCEDCAPAYHRCVMCEDIVDHQDNMRVSKWGGHICTECEGEHYVECEGCGELVPKDDTLFDDSYDDYCTECRQNGKGSWKNQEFNESIDVLYERRRDEQL